LTHSSTWRTVVVPMMTDALQGRAMAHAVEAQVEIESKV
jgi:hypothetical protein